MADYNYLQDADTITVTAPAGGYTKWVGYVVGDGIFAVATTTAAVGVECEMKRTGAFTLPKATGTTWTQGQYLYWNETAANARPTATAGDLCIGVALEAAISGATSGSVLLIPAPLAAGEGLIADPGDAGAIPVTSSGVCPMTSGAAGETRTMAVATFLGQRIVLCHDVDGGGNIVVTVTGGAGFTTLTFGDANDSIELVGIQVAGALAWRQAYDFGVAVA